MRIGKNGYIESNQTHCCTGKFNVALSLYGVLGIAPYFSEGFSEAAARVLAVVEALWSLEETVVCFLRQEFSLWSPALQWRHRLFLRYFLCSSLVNLPLLASLEERSTHGVLGCFLEARDKGNLIDEAARDRFALFWGAVAELEVEAFPCF